MNPYSKQKRAKYRTELKEPKDWRVEIDVEKGRASYRPNYGRHGLEPDKFAIDCVRDGRIILGSDNLQMTIISPLQGKKEAIGVNLASVIEERIKEDVSLKEIKNDLVNNKKITE